MAPPLNPKASPFFPHHQAPPFFPHLYYHPNTHHLSPEAKEEQHGHGTLEPKQQQEQQQLKKLHDGHNNKGVMKQRRFFKFMNCNRHSYEWRKKGEQVGSRKIFPQSNNTDHHQFLGALHNKNKQRYPLMPVRPDGDQTTVMIRNIPSKYTRNLLVNFLENHCMQENQKAKSDGVGNENRTVLAFDCVYLPIDFETGLNKGYAFVNFTESKAAWMFRMTASHMKWDLFKSQKICEIVAARLQGIENLEKFFEAMFFPCQSEEVLPLFFSPPRDGTLKGGKQRTVGRLLVKH